MLIKESNDFLNGDRLEEARKALQALVDLGVDDAVISQLGTLIVCMDAEEPVPVVVMAQEEETVVSYTKRPHKRHQWPDGVFERIRDFSIANPELTWNELSEKSEIGYSGEAIKRQFLNHGIRSYKFRPDHRNA